MEPTLRTINAVISALFFICYTYQFLYIPLVLLKKRRPLPRPAASHRYAVLIAARNEENVIAGLLDSLAAQTYDMSLVTVFVAADNCTDSTAAIAREHGAVVYERFNHVNVGKGYALDFLLQHIGADYPEGFDGYFVFDADNILSPDYLERMNESFSAGNEIVTSYRNSKNFGDNWISAGYALWFLRESRYLNGARNRLGSSAAVGGTGFLFSQRILDESHGWRFYLLTEDIEFSIYHILRAKRSPSARTRCSTTSSPPASASPSASACAGPRATYRCSAATVPTCSRARPRGAGAASTCPCPSCRRLS